MEMKNISPSPHIMVEMEKKRTRIHTLDEKNMFLLLLPT